MNYYQEHKEEISDKHKEYYKVNKYNILLRLRERNGSVRKQLKEHEELLKHDRERLKMFCEKGRVVLVVRKDINTNKEDKDR